MFGENKLKILEAIEKGFDGAKDFIEDIAVAMLAPYGTSVSGMEYRISKNRRVQEKRIVDRMNNKINKQRVHEFISRLKKDGIIAQDNRRGIPQLTMKGIKLLAKLKTRRINSLPKTRYEFTTDDTIKIIAFDVPERERRKRDWLRDVLLNLGFKKIQKSVFVGKAKLPDEFTKDLIKLKLDECVEIFVVSKQGTLRKIVLD